MDWQNLWVRHRVQIALALMGIILSGLGIYLLIFSNNSEPKIQIIDEASNESINKIVIQVTGAVNSPGVFEMSANERIIDAIEKAEGLKADADTKWVDKVLNMASKLTDGQKIYIPSIDEQADVLSAKNNGGTNGQTGEDLINSNPTSEVININTASQDELEELWGIGPVTAKSIIEQRPYSDVNELLTKKILKTNVFERNKDFLTVY